MLGRAPRTVAPKVTRKPSMLTSTLLRPLFTKAGGHPENATRVALGTPVGGGGVEGGQGGEEIVHRVLSEEKGSARFRDTP